MCKPSYMMENCVFSLRSAWPLLHVVAGTGGKRNESCKILHVQVILLIILIILDIITTIKHRKFLLMKTVPSHVCSEKSLCQK